MLFTMAGQCARTECTAARTGIVQRRQECLIRLGHRGRVEIVKVYGRQLRRCIMTFGTLKAGAGVLRMLTRVIAVELRSSGCMARSALRVHIDRAGEPAWRGSAAVTANVRAR